VNECLRFGFFDGCPKKPRPSVGHWFGSAAKPSPQSCQAQAHRRHTNDALAYCGSIETIGKAVFLISSEPARTLQIA
jgi:hypothetical protein